MGTKPAEAFAAAGHERYLIDRWFLAPPPPRGSFRPALNEVEGPALSGLEGPALSEVEGPRLRLDLPGANRDQLVLAGVFEGNIHVAGLCTAMHLDTLTSYRAEREQAGRIAGVIRATTAVNR